MYAYISDEVDQWGNVLPSGLTELGARLGSPIAYERRGQVIVLENFDQGVDDWLWSATTATSYIKAATASVVHGGYSAYMFRGAGTGGYCQLGRRFDIAPATTVGYSAWYRMYNAPDYIIFYLLVDDGTNTHQGSLLIDTATDLIYNRNSGGGYDLITVYPCTPPSEKHFRFIKFTLDLSADTYGYAIINGAEHDLSSESCQTGISGVRQILPLVEVYAEAGNDTEVYVDSLAITTMEG